MDAQKYKTVKHFHEPGDLHELTFSCYRRLAMLTDDRDCHSLAAAIDRALPLHQFCLSAFVFMPEHVHLLVWPQDPRHAAVSAFLKSLKMSASTRIKARLAVDDPDQVLALTIRERPGKDVFRFWQEGPGYDRNLRTPEAIEGAIDYIHRNPVRRGLCARAEDWYWSSARHYLGDGSQQAPDVPKVTKLPSDWQYRGVP